jgi:hypothetical protein
MLAFVDVDLRDSRWRALIKTHERRVDFFLGDPVLDQIEYRQEEATGQRSKTTERSLSSYPGPVTKMAYSPEPDHFGDPYASRV